VALVFIGSNYRSSELAWLDSLQAATSNIRDKLRGPDSPLAGAVVLATCNRFEVYLESEDFHQSLDFTMRAIAEELQEDLELIASQMDVRYGKDVIEHLFAVSSGLDSMIVGESEITGQVRRAFANAQQHGLPATGLQQLFQRALQTSKEVSRKTGIGASGKSVINTALELAGQLLGSKPMSQALLIGTGAYARVVTKTLKAKDVKNIFVYSKSGRAKGFASSQGIEAVSKAELLEVMAKSDLVVSASGHKGFSIDLQLAQEVLSKRKKKRPLVVIDVALSKDVAPEVSDLESFHVIDLEQLIRAAPVEHSEAIDRARDLVVAAAAEFANSQSSKAIDPVIIALRSHIGLWVNQEVEMAKKKLDAPTAAQVERSLSRVANAILHTPTIRAKDLAATGNHDDYVKAVKTLFDIDLSKHG
jgi:glutamyl-tRNA reductase